MIQPDQTTDPIRIGIDVKGAGLGVVGLIFVL